MRQEKMIISSLWGELLPSLAQGEKPSEVLGAEIRVPHTQILQTSLSAPTAPNTERKKHGAENCFF